MIRNSRQKKQYIFPNGERRCTQRKRRSLKQGIKKEERSRRMSRASRLHPRISTNVRVICLSKIEICALKLLLIHGRIPFDPLSFSFLPQWSRTPACRLAPNQLIRWRFSCKTSTHPGAIRIFIFSRIQPENLYICIAKGLQFSLLPNGTWG